MASFGQPSYRSGALLRWVYQKRASSFDAMSDLPRDLRVRLGEKLTLSSVSEIELRTARDGTQKVLLVLWDGRSIETALIPSAKSQFTVCVSSQVGCAIGCPFCATGQQGYERNLASSEICDQVLYFARRMEGGETISNIVFMGMGEPFANYLDVMVAVGRLNAEWGFGIGARHITISTAGHIPGIQKLGKEKLQVGLAVSLHAPDDLLRNRLVPMNRKYPLGKLIPACDAYVQATGRRVTFEYAMFDGINDSMEQARELAHLLRGLNCHINLISANPTAGCTYKPSLKETAMAFEAELARLRIPVTLRRSYGGEIDAACGQLKSRWGGV